MRWTKIKNIIILLLVIVNLALLGLVGFRSWLTVQNERQARERMIAILANNNIEFLPQEVPDTLDLEPLRLTLEPPTQAQAELLVGPIVSTEPLGARTVCVGELGEATLSPTGEIEAVYPSPSLDEAAALDRLTALGVEFRESARSLSGDGTLTLTCIQLRQGVPLPEETVTLTFQEGLLRSLSLRLLSGTWETVPGRESVTASTALLRFLEAMNRGGYVCTQVTDLYPCYSVTGSGTLTLTPTWYVETDTRPWLFPVDAQTALPASE